MLDLRGSRCPLRQRVPLRPIWGRGRLRWGRLRLQLQPPHCRRVRGSTSFPTRGQRRPVPERTIAGPDTGMDWPSFVTVAPAAVAVTEPSAARARLARKPYKRAAATSSRPSLRTQGPHFSGHVSQVHRKVLPSGLLKCAPLSRLSDPRVSPSKKRSSPRRWSAQNGSSPAPVRGPAPLAFRHGPRGLEVVVEEAAAEGSCAPPG